VVLFVVAEAINCFIVYVANSALALRKTLISSDSLVFFTGVILLFSVTFDLGCTAGGDVS